MEFDPKSLQLLIQQIIVGVLATTKEKPLETMKVIAAHLRITEKKCRRLARRNRDPLPIKVFENVANAYPSALDAWKDRNNHSLHVTEVLRDYEGHRRPSRDHTPNGKAEKTRAGEGPKGPL